MSDTVVDLTIGPPVVPPTTPRTGWHVLWTTALEATTLQAQLDAAIAASAAVEQRSRRRYRHPNLPRSSRADTRRARLQRCRMRSAPGDCIDPCVVCLTAPRRKTGKRKAHNFPCCGAIMCDRCAMGWARYPRSGLCEACTDAGRRQEGGFPRLPADVPGCTCEYKCPCCCAKLGATARRATTPKPRRRRRQVTRSTPGL